MVRWYYANRTEAPAGNGGELLEFPWGGGGEGAFAEGLSVQAADEAVSDLESPKSPSQSYVPVLSTPAGPGSGLPVFSLHLPPGRPAAAGGGGSSESGLGYLLPGGNSCR